MWVGHAVSMGDLTPEEELRQLRLESVLMSRGGKDLRRQLQVAKREEHARLASWARHASNLNARVEQGLRALETKEALLQAAKKTNEEVLPRATCVNGSKRATNAPRELQLTFVEAFLRAARVHDGETKRAALNRTQPGAADSRLREAAGGSVRSSLFGLRPPLTPAAHRRGLQHVDEHPQKHIRETCPECFRPKSAQCRPP